MTLQELQALYDLARTAPIPQAVFAPQIAALFTAVEIELARMQRLEFEAQYKKTDAA